MGGFTVDVFNTFYLYYFVHARQSILFYFIKVHFQKCLTILKETQLDYIIRCSTNLLLRTFLTSKFSEEKMRLYHFISILIILYQKKFQNSKNLKEKYVLVVYFKNSKQDQQINCQGRLQMRSAKI